MIIELLAEGKENAISTKDLCEAVGGVSVRELRKMVADERMAGAVIASSSTGGYYIPSNRSEIEEFVRTLDSKARSIMVVLRSARKFLKMTMDEDQMTLQLDKTEQNWTDWGEAV